MGSEDGRETLNRRAPLWDVSATPGDVSGDGRLNPSQDAAFRTFFLHTVTLILGPPGTGKTEVASALIKIFASKACPVLVSAQSKRAVDNLAHRSREVQDAVVVRVGNPDKIEPRLHDITLASMALERVGEEQTPAWKKVRKQWETGFVHKQASVVCATLSGAGAEHLRVHYQAVIVDEAGQAQEPAVLVPLSLARDDARIVLIGDHLQLPPHCDSQTAGFKGLSVSLFERLMMLPGIAKVALSIQYRMHPSISRWPSDEFYGGSLQNAEEVTRRPLLKGFPWARDTATAFVHVAGNESMEGTSAMNEEEQRVVRELVSSFLRAGDVSTEGIGVITPYDAQRRGIQDLLRRDKLTGVTVDNLDAYQGREKELVILSCVRANDRGAIGFLSDPRRLNVAATRAKRGFILVGHIPTILLGDHEGCFISLLKCFDHAGCVFDTQWRPLRLHHVQTDTPTHPPAKSCTTGARRQEPARMKAVWMPACEKDVGDICEYRDAMLAIADRLLSSRAFAKLLAFVADLPHNVGIRARPECALHWDRKGWSHLNFFVHRGVALDPGNVALFCGFLGLLCRAGAVSADGRSHMLCKTCAAAAAKLLPRCADVLDVPTFVRLVLVQMQTNEEGLQLCEAPSQYRLEYAGDILEALGGVCHNWRKEARAMQRDLAERYALGPAEIDAIRNGLGRFMQCVKPIVAAGWRLAQTESEVPRRLQDFILEWVPPHPSITCPWRGMRGMSLSPGCKGTRATHRGSWCASAGAFSCQ